MSAFIGLLVRLVICSNSGYGMDANHPKCIIPQGMIEMDSEFAKKIGFVSSRFLSCCYLWGEGNCIVIKTIECTERRRGYLRELFKAIWGFGVGDRRALAPKHYEGDPGALWLQEDPGGRPKLWQDGALGEIDRRCAHPGEPRENMKSLE